MQRWRSLWNLQHLITANELHISSEDLNPSFPSTPLLLPFPLPFNMGESSSLAKEQDITFSVWMTRKYFWKECVSLEQLNSKGHQGDTCSHLPSQVCMLFTDFYFVLCHRKYFHSCWVPEHKRNPYLCKWLNWGHQHLYLKKGGELTAFGLFNSSDDKGFLALSLCMWTLYWDHSGTALYRCSILVGGWGERNWYHYSLLQPFPSPFHSFSDLSLICRKFIMI